MILRVSGSDGVTAVRTNQVALLRQHRSVMFTDAMRAPFQLRQGLAFDGPFGRGRHVELDATCTRPVTNHRKQSLTIHNMQCDCQSPWAAADLIRPAVWGICFP
jgi:hypothetical protein